MKLSLSVRVGGPACKSRLLAPSEELASIARGTGCDAVCTRASAAGIGWPLGRLFEGADGVRAQGDAGADLP